MAEIKVSETELKKDSIYIAKEILTMQDKKENDVLELAGKVYEFIRPTSS
jgi:hypothetical protein